MVSAIKYRAKDGEIEVELSISVEGTPLIEDIKDFKKSIIEDVKELRDSKTENTDDEVEEGQETEEVIGLDGNKLSIKPQTSNTNLDQKLKMQNKLNPMFG